MKNSKLKNGEFVEIDEDGTLSIEYYTNGKLDCYLKVMDGHHVYRHPNGEVWRVYGRKFKTQWRLDIISS